MLNRTRDSLNHMIDVARFLYFQQTCRGRLVLLALPICVLLCCALLVFVPSAPSNQRRLSAPQKSPAVAPGTLPAQTPYPIHRALVTLTPRQAVILVPTTTPRPTASVRPTNTTTPTATLQPTDTAVPTATSSPTVTATPTPERLYVPLILQS